MSDCLCCLCDLIRIYRGGSGTSNAKSKGYDCKQVLATAPLPFYVPKVVLGKLPTL